MASTDVRVTRWLRAVNDASFALCERRRVRDTGGMSSPENAPGDLDQATEERIKELEIRIAYQDNLISDLDEVLRQFTRRVEGLEKTLDQFRGQLQALAGAPATLDEPPPHY